MSENRTNLPFLARPGYRRRRLIEAIRLLPYLGVLLFLMPLLWSTGESAGQAQTSSGWIYLFVVWFALVGLTAVAGLAYSRTREDDEANDAKKTDPSQ